MNVRMVHGKLSINVSDYHFYSGVITTAGYR